MFHQPLFSQIQRLISAIQSPANPEGLDDNSLYVTFYDVAGPLNAAGRPTVVEVKCILAAFLILTTPLLHLPNYLY